MLIVQDENCDEPILAHPFLVQGEDMRKKIKVEYSRGMLIFVALVILVFVVVLLFIDVRSYPPENYFVTCRVRMCDRTQLYYCQKMGCYCFDLAEGSWMDVQNDWFFCMSKRKFDCTVTCNKREIT
jgi:hypothetical protein